ncbi:hypothetical protein ACWDU8_03745 [Streptomyces sp. NPDC003388]|uniref:hypothetical protein n=1 Tax=unclassified Streptomyces TaxID=2593676 RepID=UPI0011700965|nr:hypothetical protein [Streptomyces sp. 1-11]GEK04337.1 hypothetical protein TNCT1_66130 [Streptomyces sp. 1-11]
MINGLLLSESGLRMSSAAIVPCAFLFLAVGAPLTGLLNPGSGAEASRPAYGGEDAVHGRGAHDGEW